MSKISTLTNSTPGGDGELSMTPEIRAKMSAARKGKSNGPHSLATRIKIGNAHRGMKRPSGTGDKIRLGRMGYKHSDGTRKLMSDVAKGKPHGPMPDWWKKRVSDAKKRLGQGFQKEARIAQKLLNSKPVICIETGVRFPSRYEAGLSVKCAANSIRLAINKGSKCRGFHWRNAE